LAGIGLAKIFAAEPEGSQQHREHFENLVFENAFRLACRKLVNIGTQVTVQL
jgi:hypothetical protein